MGEEERELVLYSVFYLRLVVSAGDGRGSFVCFGAKRVERRGGWCRYSCLKAFILFRRLISTCAMKGSG